MKKPFLTAVEIYYKTLSEIEIFKAAEVDKSLQAFYNLYCNQLLDRVTDGRIMFLDDDDILTDKTALEEINNNFYRNEEILFWKVKFGNKIIYPKDINNIQRYHISGIGFCFSSKYKKLVKWDSERC